jgi:hypothetical protein
MWPFQRKIVEEKIDNQKIRDLLTSNPTYQQLVKNQAFHAARLAELKARLIKRKSPREAVKFLQDWEEKTKVPTHEQLLDELFPVERK